MKKLWMLLPSLLIAGCGGSQYDFEDGLKTSLESPIEVPGDGNGNVEDLFEAHNWTFEGEAGDTVIVQVVSGGESDPRFTVYDEDLNALASDDDSAGAPNAVAAVELPSDGTYIIRIDFWAPGEYTINVR